MADRADKLRDLLPRWVEPHASHLKLFRPWQQRTRAQKLATVAGSKYKVDEATPPRGLILLRQGSD